MDMYAYDNEMDFQTSLRVCLEYLYTEALNGDLRLTAHLIGVAAESLAGNRIGGNGSQHMKEFHSVTS